MTERFSAVIDMAGLTDIADPVVGTILERVFALHLKDTPHRKFHLTPSVVVLLFEKSAVGQVRAALATLDAELNRLPHAGPTWRLFDLKTDLHLFRSVCRRLTAESEQRFGTVASAARRESDRQAAFLHVMDAVRMVDLTVYMHRQNVVRFDSDKSRSIEFEEAWVGMDMLERSLEVRIHEDPARFLLMTEMLDFKVLHHLNRPGTAGPRVSLNFHCENVLSPQFDPLAEAIDPLRRPQMIFELSLADFLHQPNHFALAHARLLSLGFAVAIDNATLPEWKKAAAKLPAASYVKIPWNDAFARQSAKSRARIHDIVGGHAQGPEFVLIHCGSADSVKVGRRLGFHLLQGKAVPEPAPKPAVTAIAAVAAEDTVEGAAAADANRVTPPSETR